MAVLDFLGVAKEIIGVVKEYLPESERQKMKEDRELELKLAAMFEENVSQQLEVNKVEAAHSSIFVAGWRPFIGWVCGFALAYHYILQPFLAFGLAIFNINVHLPVFDMDTLFTLLFGLLGLGTMRTVEKIKKVTK